MVTPNPPLPSPSDTHDASGQKFTANLGATAAASELSGPDALAVVSPSAVLHPAPNHSEEGGLPQSDTQSGGASPSLPDHTGADAGLSCLDAHSTRARPAPVIDHAGGDGGQLPVVNQKEDAPSPLPALLELAARRRNAMRERMAMQRKQEAYARVLLGYRPGEDNGVKERAAAMLKAVRAGKHGVESPTVAALLADYLTLHDPSIAACEAVQAKHEKSIAKLVEGLPAWPWVKACKGFGANNLASLLAETGNLSNYSNPAKLWKRMGVGLVGDRRQGNPADRDDKAAWIAHGYKAERRAVLWNIGTTILKQKDTYYALYLERRKLEKAKLGVAEDAKSIVAHRRAQRWMEKRVLRDLWRAWRGTN